jgi:antitoxin HicB
MSELDKYLALPYTLRLRRDNEGDFVGHIEELPGCSAHGKTPQEALHNLEEAKSLWIEDCLENGNRVPVPEEEIELPSGKWLQRVPRKLHRKLQLLSRKEGVSFNQYVTALLAEAVGERRTTQADEVSIVQSKPDLTSDFEHFFLESNAGPVSPWRVVDGTPRTHTSYRFCYLDALTRLAYQLPKKTITKLKEKPDAKKEHAAFGVC